MSKNKKTVVTDRVDVDWVEGLEGKNKKEAIDYLHSIMDDNTYLEISYDSYTPYYYKVDRRVETDEEFDNRIKAEKAAAKIKQELAQEAKARKLVDDSKNIRDTIKNLQNHIKDLEKLL